MVSSAIFKRHQRVLIDTAVWIYHFAEHPVFGEIAGRVIEALEAGKFRGIASELTLLETTVKPLQHGRQDAADDYETLLSYFPNLDLVPVSRAILLDAAGLRARHGLRTPDAIQLATAFAAGATLAVTNDDSWRNIGGVETLLLSEPEA